MLQNFNTNSKGERLTRNLLERLRPNDETILAAVLLAWAVGVDLRNNPRTEDAQVRANVIGVAPQVGGAVKEIHVVRIVIDEPETVSFRMGGSASVIVHTGRGTREGEARLRKLQRSSELPFNSPVDE